MAYAIVRTDSMSGTTDFSMLVHGRYVGADDKYAEIENGSIVLVGDLEANERESHKYLDIAEDTTIQQVALVAEPELIRDECHHKGIADYINVAGKCIRAYMLHKNDVFAVSADAFIGTAPTKGQAVSINSGKHKMVAGTGDLAIGKCIDIEVKKYQTYYVIKPELFPASV